MLENACSANARQAMPSPPEPYVARARGGHRPPGRERQAEQPRVPARPWQGKAPRAALHGAGGLGGGGTKPPTQGTQTLSWHHGTAHSPAQHRRFSPVGAVGQHLTRGQNGWRSSNRRVLVSTTG